MSTTDVDAIDVERPITLDDLGWAMRLGDDLHRLPPRSAARHARFVELVGGRLDAEGIAFVFHADAAGGAALIRQLTGRPAVAAIDRARLDAKVALAVEAIAGHARRPAGGSLAHALPLGNGRYAAVVFGRAERFVEADAQWLAVVHGHLAWLYEAYAPPGGALLHALSPRERETLAHLLGGASEKQVAATIGRSPHTIHAYVKRIYKTLGVNSRGELLAIFVDADARRGLAAGIQRPAGAAPAAGRVTYSS